MTIKVDVDDDLRVSRRRRMICEPTAVAAALLVTVVTACATEAPSANPIVTPPGSAATLPAETTSPTSDAISDIDYVEYLDVVIDLLEARYYDRDNVDWSTIRAATTDAPSDGPLSAAAAHRRVLTAFQMLGDQHSGFIAPEFATDYQQDVGGADRPMPSGDRVGDVGHLVLPAFSGTDRGALNAYLEAARVAMRSADEGGPVCGWVVDLRDNTGGNMYPMLGAVSALLGEGRVLGTKPGSTWIEVTADGGLRLTGGSESLWQDDVLESSLIEVLESPDDGGLVELLQAHEPYRPALAEPPVAVLVSNMTASAAEFVTVAFEGRSRTATFGAHTAGVPTAPAVFRMADGAIVRLAVAAAVDRNGEVYTDSIAPDHLVADTRLTGSDAVLDEAVTWIANIGTCN